MTPPKLLVCAPLRSEARALRRGLGEDAQQSTVLRTGFGPQRSARRATAVSQRQFDALAVAGVGGAVTDRIAPGEVVVATEIQDRTGEQRSTIHCPSAPLLAGALRRRGFTVHCGPIATTDHVVRGAECDELAAAGVLAVDMESALLTEAGSGSAPLAVARVITDTPAHPLAGAGILRRGRQALRMLPEVGQALEQWAAAARRHRVLLPAPRSFCAGVERAIEIVELALEQHGPPVYVRKQIVHNAHVVADLADRGAVFVDELDEVPEGATTVFSAHGVSPQVRGDADRRRLQVIDGTCPLVSKVHAEARRFTRDDGTVLFIGHSGHEETEGTLGESPDRIVLVETVEDAWRVEVPDPARVSYLMQTTLSVDESADIVAALRTRFPALRGPGSDDICYATTNRQTALQAVAAQADLVLVIGSVNSSNSRRLVETAHRVGAPAHLVDDVSQVAPEWLADADTVAVTAGASAPPTLVDELLEALRGLGPLEVTEHRLATETIQFALPKEVS